MCELSYLGPFLFRKFQVTVSTQWNPVSYTRHVPRDLSFLVDQLVYGETPRQDNITPKKAFALKKKLAMLRKEMKSAHAASTWLPEWESQKQNNTN